MSRGLHMTEAQVRVHAKRHGFEITELSGAQTIPPVIKLTDAPKGPKMNKTESEYGRILESLQAGGMIKEFAFEPFSLRYGKDAFYKPDFVIQHRSLSGCSLGTLSRLCAQNAIDTVIDAEMYFAMRQLIETESKCFEIVEVKGGHIYPEAKPRFKAAWERYGSIFQFSMIQKQKTGWVKILGDV